MATTALGLSEKQKAMRATGLGASEIPILLGLSPFKAAAELAAEKRGELPPFEGNTFTHWGQRLERTIAEEWLEQHRAKGEDVSIFTPPTLRHRTSEVVLATLDRAVVPEGRRARDAWVAALEAKNVSAYRSEEFGEGEDAIPEAFIVQVQTQLEVAELPVGYLATLIGGNQFREYRLERDPELGGNLVQLAEKWWADHVVQGLPVPVDGSRASSDFLRRRFPMEHGPLLDPSPEFERIVAQVRAAKEALRAAEEAEAAATNALRQAIGEASGIAGLATWKANKPSTKTDWEAVARAAGVSPEIIAAHTVTKPGARVLRLAKEK